MRSTSYTRRIQFEKLEPRHMLAYLPGDFDQSGVVDNGDYNVWRAEYGTEMESLADGNGDFVVDGADYIIWRKNVGKTLADVAPDAPNRVEARAVGATSITVTWQASANTTSYTVLRRDPSTESEFSTIMSGVTLTSFTDTTAVTNTLYEYRVAATNAHGSSGGSQTSEATAGQSNLKVYQPQDIQDEANPQAGPLYDFPFPKKAVPEAQEFHNAFGPGIRINNDPDPVVNGISTEDDLVEVRIERVGSSAVALARSGALNLYYDYAGTMPIPLTDAFHTVALTLNSDNYLSVFVEWAGGRGHGTDTLSLVDATTLATIDSVRFHSFRSVIVMFGGRGHNASDKDGDGNIGDHVGGILVGNNREGDFDFAQALRDSGWNVLAYASPEIATATVIQPAYDEIVNEITYQSVGNPFDYSGGVAVMGYSWGGGVAHDLIDKLWDDFDYNVLYGVFWDAVQHPLKAPAETDFPEGLFYLLNIYQTFSFPRGGTIEPENVPAGSQLEDVNTTTAPGFPGDVPHQLIDDAISVKNRIGLRLSQLMFR
jgi:hypothetical protein